MEGPPSSYGLRPQVLPNLPKRALFEGETDLQGYLVMAGFVVGDMAADLADFEPPEVPEGSGSLADRGVDCGRYALIGCADDFHYFVHMVGHAVPLLCLFCLGGDDKGAGWVRPLAGAQASECGRVVVEHADRFTG